MAVARLARQRWSGRHRALTLDSSSAVGHEAGKYLTHQKANVSRRKATRPSETIAASSWAGEAVTPAASSHSLGEGPVLSRPWAVRRGARRFVSTRRRSGSR